MATQSAGRPRDPAIDERVLAVAASHLARHGYEGMSVVAVAEEAGTTRQAVYRRWPTRADLATAAIASLAAAQRRPPTGHPFTDLVAELRSFQKGVSRPDGLSMVGTMLNSATEPELVQLYRSRVVAPRRAALREILEQARAEGLIDADADIAIALTMLTGSWYARALAGDAVPRGWAERTARLAWRALGGAPHEG